MKHIFLIGFLLISFSSVVNAQKSELTGEWLATRVEAQGQIQEPYMVQEFTADGKMIIMGMDAGTWEYLKSSNSIEMKSEFDKDFNGKTKILKLEAGELVVVKDDTKIFYTKVNAIKIAAGNKISGLEGSWEISDAAVSKYIKFELPDLYTLVEKGDGMTSTAKGTWMFDAEDKTLIMTGMSVLAGKNIISDKSSKKVVIQQGDNTFILTKKSAKQASNTGEIERLTFAYEDFFTEYGDFKHEADIEKLPWQDGMNMMMSLINVKQLVYKYSTLVQDAGVFEYKTLTADVQSMPAEQTLNIDYIFYGYDRYNLPEDAALPLNENYESLLYPEEENTFRIAGTEEITTPAGSYDCVVVEVAIDDESRKKLWMIKDKPGIYAKIIDDKAGTWGHYHIYELEAIK